MIGLFAKWFPTKQEPDWEAKLVASMEKNLARDAAKRSAAARKGWDTRRTVRHG